MTEMAKVKLGIETLANYPALIKLLKSKRVALLTNPTGVDSNFNSTVDILKTSCNLTLLLAPEHGVRGNLPAGEKFSNFFDETTGLMVYSLYGSASKHISSDVLDQFDVLVYDIQDLGCRFYTYPYSLLYAMQDCAAADKTVVVLDRPNPLGGETVEGNIISEDYLSFVGAFPMPIRYGLTIAEFALMAKDFYKLDLDLQVVKMENWTRDMLWPDTGLRWVSPSPNIPNFEIAYIYPGNCLAEGTNLSEGRGTALPFKQIGASYITEPEKVTAAMTAKKIPGVKFRSTYFTPTFSKHEGKLCGGVEFYVDDYKTYRPVRTALEFLYELMKIYPADFTWQSVLPPHDKSFIMLLTGNREVYDHEELSQIFAEYDQDESDFNKYKRTYHLY